MSDWIENTGAMPDFVEGELIDVEFADRHIVTNQLPDTVVKYWELEGVQWDILRWRYSKNNKVRIDEGLALPAEENYHKYGDDKGNDKIDEWAAKYSHERFRNIMWAMMDKYECRLGKKDSILKETTKMLDYMARWQAYEIIWAEEE